MSDPVFVLGSEAHEHSSLVSPPLIADIKLVDFRDLNGVISA